VLDQRHEELLRRLALNDDTTVEAALGMSLSHIDGAALDAKTQALVRLGGLIGMRSTSPCYGWCVTAAQAVGATDEEVVAVLVALGPVIGVARVSHAAREIAVALGRDLDSPVDT
jgi:alkylhydroperoxidase/carboxymuconolactone decarboxylase family protein YurZ